MIIRTKVPLRISFAGEETDIPPYPQTESGCVICATINKYAIVLYIQQKIIKSVLNR